MPRILSDRSNFLRAQLAALLAFNVSCLVELRGLMSAAEPAKVGIALKSPWRTVGQRGPILRRDFAAPSGRIREEMRSCLAVKWNPGSIFFVLILLTLHGNRKKNYAIGDVNRQRAYGRIVPAVFAL